MFCMLEENASFETNSKINYCFFFKEKKIAEERFYVQGSSSTDRMQL